MTSAGGFLYLTDENVRALALDVRSVRLAIHNSFELYSKGELRCEPKISSSIGPGHAFQALAAVDMRNNYAAIKWLGMVPPGGAAKVNINASLLLSDTRTGQVRCLMDGRHATALRTAGMSAVGAQYLARKESISIGFVGAGVQAESHLLALVEVLPSLRKLYVNSLSLITAERFAERARQLGFEATVASAQDTVSYSDIVVTAVPLVPGFQPFIEAAWIRPGALVIAIDLGRSWKHDGLCDVDLTFVDEVAMKNSAKPGNFIPPLNYAQATLADLAGGRHRGRSRQEERIMMFSGGSAAADLSIAMVIYERALARGVGIELED
jgi:ornithine cyclodeaminase/alanine dehydrogenase-like protein (mu-crystallin family)